MNYYYIMYKKKSYRQFAYDSSNKLSIEELNSIIKWLKENTEQITDDPTIKKLITQPVKQ